MSDLMLHGVLNMPLPDDPSDLDLITWVQFRDRARQASTMIEALTEENATLRTEKHADAEAIGALREEVDRLKSPPEEYCIKCGSPKSNHPYRHPFVGQLKGDTPS